MTGNATHLAGWLLALAAVILVSVLARRVRTSWRAARARRAAFDAHLAAAHAAIEPLSLEEARRLAAPHLDDHSLLWIERSESATPPAGLAPELAALFRRYARIADQGLGLVRAEVSPLPEWHPLAPTGTFLQLCEDFEHRKLIVRPNQETILVCADDTDNLDHIIEEQYPSFYHWVLSIAAERDAGQHLDRSDCG